MTKEEQIIEKIAKQLYHNENICIGNSNILYKWNWDEIPEYEPIRRNVLKIRDEYKKKAEHFLEAIQTATLMLKIAEMFQSLMVTNEQAIKE